MKEDTPIHHHLNLFNKIICDLLRIEGKIEDEDKVLILLSSLSPSYEHLVTTLLYGKYSIGMEEVTYALLLNEMQKKTVEAESQADGLLMTSPEKIGFIH